MEILEDLKNASTEMKTYLTRKKKVKMLPLYEPVIEEAGSRKETRKQRELKKLKKEVKSNI